VRGGVVTVATRTVADKRVWDMVGSFRVVPGWRKGRFSVCAVGSVEGGGAAAARWVLSVAHPADVVVTANADGFCGFGRHGDADRREVTPVRGDL
jgi:hypothetical protein